MIPGPPAICEGSVVHLRAEIAEHQFTSSVSQVWIDPDRPDDLCRQHWAWSATRPSPVRFRRSDYGGQSQATLSDEVRAELSVVLGRQVDGPVRMLTQLRRWGWLFNPITVFFLWDSEPGPPVGAVDIGPPVGVVGTGPPVGVVLEVTNTPWKERHRYAVALESDGGDLRAEFDKALHVSPFLEMDYRYALRVADRDDRVAIDIDVVDASGDVAVHTALRTGREPATAALLARSLRSQPMPTHRVSAGIHAQAAHLWRKGVPFVSHPKKTKEKQRGAKEPAPINEPMPMQKRRP